MSVMKILTYIITSIITNPTGLYAILAIMSVSTFRTAVILYIVHTNLGWWFMVFNTTFNNISAISWRSVLLMKENGVPGENHRPVSDLVR